MGRTNTIEKEKVSRMREPITLANLGALPVSELRRRPKTTEIALDDLPLSSLATDPEFSRRFKRVCKGIAPVAFTRIPVSDILPGFVQEDGGTRRVVSDPLSDADVESERERITRGHRSALHLYEHGESGLAPYACADDQLALLAYRALGFREVPAVLMVCFR